MSLTLGSRAGRATARAPACALVAAAAALGAVACGGPNAEAPGPRSPSAASAASASRTASSARAESADRSTPPSPLDWAATTSSPSSGRPQSGLAARLLAACGRDDGGLDAVADHLAARGARGAPLVDNERIDTWLRTAGTPQTWPTAYTARARAKDEEILASFTRWRTAQRVRGEARCGVAVGNGAAGTREVAVVLVDALADLDPLPTRSHAGSWLTLSAKLLVPARTASVLVLGPHGGPRSVPSALDGDRLRARFAPDQPGAFTVQVLADVDGGPRPVLEARVFADVDPPRDQPDPSAPGEEAAAAASSPTEAISAMVAAARATDGVPTLTRDPALDRLARAHAEAMQKRGRVAHDAGDGDPAARLERSDYPAREVGENVAHAESTVAAHRALWASPSHRRNLLDDRFDRLGVAAVTGPDGSVWVVELFARTR